MPFEFHFQYRFHPAGQGVFASGTVEDESASSPFHWVFDCGSTSPKTVLRPVVERHRDLILVERRLDLLCLSHFDYDHVSGLGDLLQDLHVGTVVIPYYTPIERLLIGLKYRRTSSEYFEFLGNPVAFVLERAASVEEIILVGVNPPEGPFGRVVADRPPIEPDGEIHRPTQIENWPLKFTDFSPAPIDDDWIVDEETRDLAERLETKLRTVPASCRAIAHGRYADWEFLFFHKPIDPGVIAELQEKLEPVFQSRGYQRRFNDLAKVLKGLTARREIKLIFEETLDSPEDINSTSLCVYSGPFSFNGPSRGGTTGPFPHSLIGGWGNLSWWEHFPIHSSILYTGDADFSNRLNRQEVRDFLADPKHGTSNPPRWNQISILQVPHHGSRNNWEPGAVAEFGHRWSVFCADKYHLKYKHPHREVLLDLLHRSPLLANKHQGWNWQGTVHFP